jgi:hypothetical protein
MQASIGVSAGPVRLSQGLPGCGAIAALIPLGMVILPIVWVHGATQPTMTTMSGDGHYAATISAPDDMKIAPGFYRSTAPKSINPTFTDDDACTWQVVKGNGDEVLDGEAKPGKKATVHVSRGEHLYTFNCGTWTKDGA